MIVTYQDFGDDHWVAQDEAHPLLRGHGDTEPDAIADLEAKVAARRARYATPPRDAA